MPNFEVHFDVAAVLSFARINKSEVIIKNAFADI